VGVTDAKEIMMKNEAVFPAQARAWMEDSVLQPYISEFSSDLEHERYAAATRGHYLSCAGHFSAWVTQQGFKIEQVDERSVAHFVAEHLPHCNCSSRARRSGNDFKASLAHLLHTLRACRVIPNEEIARDPLQDELDRFDRYMEEVKGLARSTRRHSVAVVRRFLTRKGASGSISLARIQPKDISRFVLGEQTTYAQGTIKLFCGIIRNYLQFRAFTGDSVQRLLDAVPNVARWRLASLPETLSEQEVQQLLDSFGQPSRAAKRDYAMVRCMTDLGLRACEVIQLRLSDIDWRAGTIRLVANKSRRTDVLPLLAETGSAIAEYLRAERPRTSNRALFVRHCAPFDKPVKANVVRKAVMQAYRRCGLPYSRVHILRHSLASRLLLAGSPLKEISDILRHRCLDTSMIYTKVDVNKLSTVAMPWPGRSI
jgi:integrase